MRIFLIIVAMIFTFSVFCNAQTNAKNTNGIKKKKDWDLGLSVGMNLSKGNSDKFGIGSEFSFSKKNKRLEFFIDGSINYGESSGKKDTFRWANTTMFDLVFLKRETFFFFINTSGNEFQDLKLRLQGGTGFKHAFFWTDNAEISVSAAILAEYKLFYLSDDYNVISRLSLRPKLKYKIDRFMFKFHFFYQPRVDHWPDYRLLSVLEMDFKIIKFLFFNIKFNHEYNNSVQVEVKKNDMNIMASIKLKF